MFWMVLVAVQPILALQPEEELQDDEETKELILQILQRIAPRWHLSCCSQHVCSKGIQCAVVLAWLWPNPKEYCWWWLFVRSLFQVEGLTSHWYKTLWQYILTCSLLEPCFDPFCSGYSWNGNEPKEGIRGKAEDIRLCRRVWGVGDNRICTFPWWRHPCTFGKNILGPVTGIPSIIITCCKWAKQALLLIN